MARWSPTVLPEVGRLAPMFDIGSALEEVAGGISNYKDSKRREAEQQRADDRYYDAENNRRIDRALDRQRQGERDKLDAADRKRRMERDYLDTKGKAADDGYRTEGQRADRQQTARGVQDLGAVGPGAMGMAASGIGDALLAASTGGDTMTMTRPDDTQETLYQDPTQTKEARDENEWNRRQEQQYRNRPAPRDPVADHLREYRGKLDIDRELKINDFAPKAPRGGGGGGGGVNDPRIGIADKMFDNARVMESQLDREKPQAPVFDPFTRQTWAKDSTNIANRYKADSSAWADRSRRVKASANQWFSIGDALAKEAVGATGGDAVATGRQLDAQVRITALQERVNRKLLEVQDDPAAQDKIRRWYADEVQSINQTYGIRPNEE